MVPEFITKPFTLDDEAESEVYILIDRHLRTLPKKSDGTIDKDTDGFQHNDVDALRHAYVSGVYTMEYGEKMAKLLGDLQELSVQWIYRKGTPAAKGTNMDYWNNQVGRKYGKKSKSRKDLFQYLLKAIKNGELIIDLEDPRKFKGKTSKKKIDGLVMVLKESHTGENLIFLDVEKKLMLSKFEFVKKIKSEEYKYYEVRSIEGKETPVSKKDGLNFNNLG